MKFASHYVFDAQLDKQWIAYQNLHTSPEALTSFLRRWRAEDENNRYLGRRSIFDESQQVTRKRIPKNLAQLLDHPSDPLLRKVLERWKYNVIVRDASDDVDAANGVQGFYLIPIQFWDLLGWTHLEQNFMFKYLVTEQNGVTKIERGWFARNLPRDWFAQLTDRIFGK